MFWRNKKETGANWVIRLLALLKAKMDQEAFNDWDGGLSDWSAGFIAGFTAYGIRGDASDNDNFSVILPEIRDNYEAVLYALYDDPKSLSHMLTTSNPNYSLLRSWRDGYGYGWRNAESWKTDGEVTFAWLDHVNRPR